MKNIRIGNDILLNFPIIFENSTPEQVRKMQFDVIVLPSIPKQESQSVQQSPADKYKYRICDDHEGYNWKFEEFQKHHKHACKLIHKIVEKEDDTYVFQVYWPAYHQHALGKYDIIVIGKPCAVGQCVCDQREFVNLVAYSEDADQEFTEDAEPILVLHPLTIDFGGGCDCRLITKEEIADVFDVSNMYTLDYCELITIDEKLLLVKDQVI